MGVERFVMSGWAGTGHNPVLGTINQAVMIAVSQGAHDRAVDDAYARLGQPGVIMLAHHAFTQMVIAYARADAQQRAAASQARKEAQAREAQEKLEQAQAEESSVEVPDTLKAIEGRVGIYSRSRADGTHSYVAKWPDASTRSGTKTKGGFETPDEAETYRDQMTKELVS